MNQATIFRILIVASMALGALGAFVDSFFPELLPPVLEDAYEAHVASEELTMSFAIALLGFMLILFVAALAGTIGLLLFKPCGRPLSLWLTFLAVLTYPVFGPVVYSGWATMFIEISTMLWGAALAMAYFSEIKVRFDRKFADNPMQPTRDDARS